MECRVWLALSFTLVAAAVNAQPAQMTDDQQAWFYCLVSKNWCVSRSTDKNTQQGRLVAMVSANKPAYFHGQVTRVTLQVACSDGAPVTMLMSGREVGEGDIAMEYQVSPSGKTAKLVAKQASAGHFFEIRDTQFLADLRDGVRMNVKLSFPSDPKPSPLEYDLTNTESALKRLGCF